MFVLVQGNLQGVTKKSKNKNVPPISQASFLREFKVIFNRISHSPSDLTYLEAKQLSKVYSKSLEDFYSVYQDWIRTDREKFYCFK
jgi:hypothetical protein